MFVGWRNEVRTARVTVYKLWCAGTRGLPAGRASCDEMTRQRRGRQLPRVREMRVAAICYGRRILHMIRTPAYRRQVSQLWLHAATT